MEETQRISNLVYLIRKENRNKNRNSISVNDKGVNTIRKENFVREREEDNKEEKEEEVLQMTKAWKEKKGRGGKTQDVNGEERKRISWCRKG